MMVSGATPTDNEPKFRDPNIAQNISAIAYRPPPTPSTANASLDEKRNGNEANNYQRGSCHKHISDAKTCGTRSHGYFVIVSDDRTLVLIHRKLSWGRNIAR
jgi:hypothetical protein